MSELVFKGKEFVYNHHLSVPFRPLVPHVEKGIGPVDLSGNLIIHGDNLHALKALLPMYAGKVDCIFIDPPYNTGNEGWSYNDNVNSPMIREWLASNPIGVEDGLRHDKWCAMMWPRLRLLHELLAPSGAMFVCIDDNESHRLELMLEEIFGSDSRVGRIIARLNPKGRHLDEFVAKTHEYLLCFVKDPDLADLGGVPKDERMLSEYNEEDGGGKYRALGLRNRNAAFNPETRSGLYFPIYVNPKTCEVWAAQKNNEEVEEPPSGFTDEVLPLDGKGEPTCWTWNPAKVKRDNHLLFARKTNEGEWRVFRKDYMLSADGEEPSTKAKTIWLDAEFNMDAGRKHLNEVMGRKMFDFPKPVPYIERALELIQNPDCLVLDSFAGSGSTAEAVLRLNHSDGGSRRFILVEMEDYADQLTAERVRRVIQGYKGGKTEKTELFKQKLNWRSIKNSSEWIGKAEAIEGSLFTDRYTKIKKEIRDGELVIIGETASQERVDGLGGKFTFCTLGDPVELDKVLSGETLPPYEGLGSALFHMATNRAIDAGIVREDDFYLGSTEGQHVWLIYRPDLEWLKSPEAALTLARAKAFAEIDPNKKHLVFAPARFVSQKMLAEQKIPVEFVPLPFALYRIDRS
ncbi:site-specific DNA-methyltransferase [Phormidesmis sp. 146-33]